MTIITTPRIPQIIQQPLLCICVSCRQAQTVGKGELWPAYCECGGVLSAGHDPRKDGE